MGDYVLWRPSKRQYSFETEKHVVERFLAGETKMELARAFDLSSPALVRLWVQQWHQSGEEGVKPKGRPKDSGRPAPVTEEASCAVRTHACRQKMRR